MPTKCVLILLALLATVTLPAPLPADQTSPVGSEVADLKEQLEDGLKARLPREFEFIETVVELVAKDELPLPLVKSTFQWARKKAGNRRYPFPYFERALRIRAKRIGVTIP